MKNFTDRIKAYFNELIPKKEDTESYKRIANITFPAFVELFLSFFFTAVDMVMVGRLDKAAIAGVGLTNQPFQLIISVFAAINVGTTTLVAWNIGAGNKKMASRITRQAIMFNLSLGVLMSFAGFFLSPYITRFVGTDEEVIAYADVYLRILCTGVVFQAVNMGITAAFRGCGETRIPMLYNVASNGLNVILNYLLIYGKFGFPELGVAGAAIATTASRVAASLAAVYFVFVWKDSPVKLSFKSGWKPDFKTIYRIFTVGIPAAGEQFVIQTGLILFSKMINTMEVAYVAAHQTALSVNGLVFAVSQAFSVSTTALVGQSVGSDDYATAEKYTVFTRRLARVCTAVIAVVFIVFAQYICRIYSKDAEVVTIAASLFPFLALVQFMQSSQMSTAGALRGAGDTMYPLYATIFGIWIFRIGVCALLVFVFGFGLHGAWLAFSLDQWMRGVVVKQRFKSGKWKAMKAQKEEKARRLKEKLGSFD